MNTNTSASASARDAAATATVVAVNHRQERDGVSKPTIFGIAAVAGIAAAVAAGTAAVVLVKRKNRKNEERRQRDELSLVPPSSVVPEGAMLRRAAASAASYQPMVARPQLAFEQWNGRAQSQAQRDHEHGYHHEQHDRDYQPESHLGERASDPAEALLHQKRDPAVHSDQKNGVANRSGFGGPSAANLRHSVALADAIVGRGETIFVVAVAGCGAGSGTLKGIDAARVAASFAADALASASDPSRVVVAVHITVPGRSPDSDASRERSAFWDMVHPQLVKALQSARPDSLSRREDARAAADALGPGRIRVVVAGKAKGASAARHSLERVAYRGERWVLHADVRVAFVHGWDDCALREWRRARVRSPRPVITHPAASDGSRNPTPVPLAPAPPTFLVFERFSASGTPVFETAVCGSLPNRPLPTIARSPDFAFALAADALGAGLHDPWLEHLSERDVAWSMTVRLWTAGCDFFLPSRAIAWKRRSCLPPAESQRNARLSVRTSAEQKAAYARLWALVGLQPPIVLDRYGIVAGIPVPLPAPSEVVGGASRAFVPSMRAGWDWMWRGDDPLASGNEDTSDPRYQLRKHQRDQYRQGLEFDAAFHQQEHRRSTSEPRATKKLYVIPPVPAWIAGSNKSGASAGNDNNNNNNSNNNNGNANSRVSNVGGGDDDSNRPREFLLEEIPRTHTPPRPLRELARIIGVDWRAGTCKKHALMGLLRPPGSSETDIETLNPRLWAADELLSKYGSWAAFHAAVREVTRAVDRQDSR